MKIARGFTLVEILVVIVIVGLLASMAILTIGSNPQQLLKQEAQRALAVLQLATDEALLEGREYGLFIDRESYQIVQFNEQTLLWEADPTPAFARYSLPNDINMNLESEGKVVDLGKLLNRDSEQKQQTENNLQPRLLLLSSGEVTPFTLAFSADYLPKRFTLSSDGLAGIKLGSTDEQ